MGILADKCNLSEEEEQQMMDGIKQAVAGIATSTAVGVAMAVVDEVVKKLTTSNYENKNITGDQEVHPTEDQAVLDKKKATANENEGALAKDGVSAQEGEVKASETEAKANENEAKASETEAEAMQTKAGAMDVATKGMKIN